MIHRKYLITYFITKINIYCYRIQRLFLNYNLVAGAAVHENALKILSRIVYQIICLIKCLILSVKMILFSVEIYFSGNCWHKCLLLSLLMNDLSLVMEDWYTGSYTWDLLNYYYYCTDIVSYVSCSVPVVVRSHTILAPPVLT